MRKRIIMGLMAVAILILSTSVNVQAAEKWDKAEKAYMKFLKKYQSTYVMPDDWGKEDNTENYKYCSTYSIKDMNNDGVPELLTNHDTNWKQGDIYIFTYKDGKVKKVKNGRISVTCSASGGWYNTYFCKERHLHVERAGGLIGPLYRVYRLTSKGKLVKYLQWEENNVENKETFKKNGKIITKKEYERLYRKCGTKQETVDWKNNSAAEKILYYCSVLSGSKGDKEMEIPGIKKIIFKKDKVILYSSGLKYEKSYKSTATWCNYKKRVYKFAKKVKYYGEGGEGPRITYSKEAFQNICKAYSGLDLEIKLKNNKVVTMTLQS